MPKYTEPWEDEYIDPVSEAEDAKERAASELETARFMEDLLMMDYYEDRKLMFESAEDRRTELLNRTTPLEW